jgi:hypothetical protein
MFSFSFFVLKKKEENQCVPLPPPAFFFFKTKKLNENIKHIGGRTFQGLMEPFI